MRLVLLCVLGLVAASDRPISSHLRRLLSNPTVKHSLAINVQVPAVLPHVPVAIPVPIPVQPQPQPQSAQCSNYQCCTDCLNEQGCLWDPNTLNGGTCKPTLQCDFTVERLEIPVPVPVGGLPPATACVRDPAQCGITDFNGAPLDPNQDRGAGCTNSGQCGGGQYCVDCTQCSGQHCQSMCGGFGGYVSGYCAPSSLCQVNQDSIDNYCPAQAHSSSNCFYNDCYSCAAAPGCAWSGTYCYVANWPCSSPGCANDPSQCGGWGQGGWQGQGGWGQGGWQGQGGWGQGGWQGQGQGGSSQGGSSGSCTMSDCQSCAAGLGCAWSGSYCYDQNDPCTQPGCANYPNQC